MNLIEDLYKRQKPGLEKFLIRESFHQSHPDGIRDSSRRAAKFAELIKRGPIDDQLAVGVFIWHPAYGMGTITAVRTARDGVWYLVRFDYARNPENWIKSNCLETLDFAPQS